MAKPTKADARKNDPYSNDVDLDSIKLPEDNDPAMPYRTACFEKPVTDQWTHAELNLPQW